MGNFASTPKTGLLTDYFFRGVSLGNIAYFANGLNRYIAYDLVTARGMGILPPPAKMTDEGTSPSGSLIVGGIYIAGFEYVDKNTGYVSAFSPDSAEIICGANGGIRVNVLADSAIDSHVTHIRAYLTSDAGAVKRYDGEKVYTGSAITYDFTVAENARVTAMGELASDGLSNVDVHLVPPGAKYLMTHQNRVWFYGTVIYTVAMTFTNGSKTVAGAGFVDGMRNMYCQKKGDGRLYVIDGVPTSAVELELTEDYDGSDGSVLGYIFGEDSILYYSYITPSGNPRPESVPTSNWIPVSKDDGQFGTGMAKVGGVTPVISKRNSLYLLSGDRPANYETVLLSDKEGFVSDRAAFNNDKGHLIFVSMNGVNVTDSSEVFSLTDDTIQNIFTGEDNPPWTINKDRLPHCHGVFDKENKRGMIWVATSDSDVENRCIVYDFKKVDGQPIGWFWWDIKAVCSAIIVDDNGYSWVCWQDSLGYIYRLDASATNDGAGMPATETRRGTATGGTTTYLDMSTAVFDTIGDGLTGIKIKILSGAAAGDERIIASNTATRITPTVAFSEAIDDTSVFAIGYLSSYRKTGWLDMGSLLDKILDKIKMVFSVADSIYSAYLKHYVNFSTTQFGSTKYIDMSSSKGYHSSRVAANRSKHHQLEFGLEDTDRVITIKEIEIEGGVFGQSEETAGVQE